MNVLTDILTFASALVIFAQNIVKLLQSIRKEDEMDNDHVI